MVLRACPSLDGLVSYDNNDGNYVCIFNMIILEYFLTFQWGQKVREIA